MTALLVIGHALLATVAATPPPDKLPDAQCLPRLALAAAFGTYEVALRYEGTESWMADAGWAVLGKWTVIDEALSVDVVQLWGKEGSCILAFEGTDDEHVTTSFRKFKLEKEKILYDDIRVSSGIREETLGIKSLVEHSFPLIRLGCSEKLTLTGHSLGGAVASTFATMLNADGDPWGAGLEVTDLITFGALATGSTPLPNDKAADKCWPSSSFQVHAMESKSTNEVDFTLNYSPGAYTWPRMRKLGVRIGAEEDDSRPISGYYPDGNTRAPNGALGFEYSCGQQIDQSKFVGPQRGHRAGESDIKRWSGWLMGGAHMLLGYLLGANPVLHGFSSYESATQCYLNCTEDASGAYVCYELVGGGEIAAVVPASAAGSLAVTEFDSSAGMCWWGDCASSTSRRMLAVGAVIGIVLAAAAVFCFLTCLCVAPADHFNCCGQYEGIFPVGQSEHCTFPIPCGIKEPHGGEADQVTGHLYCACPQCCMRNPSHYCCRRCGCQGEEEYDCAGCYWLNGCLPVPDQCGCSDAKSCACARRLRCLKAIDRRNGKTDPTALKRDTIQPPCACCHHNSCCPCRNYCNGQVPPPSPSYSAAGVQQQPPDALVEGQPTVGSPASNVSMV